MTYLHIQSCAVSQRVSVVLTRRIRYTSVSVAQTQALSINVSSDHSDDEGVLYIQERCEEYEKDTNPFAAGHIQLPYYWDRERKNIEV